MSDAQETRTSGAPSGACATCDVYRAAELRKLGLADGKFDFVVALAGNPNTGKSTVFNALTGLRQHTGNWPGKTVARAEGGFGFRDRRYRLVDLPGTYSLLSTSVDEEIARDFLLFGRPDVTVIVADATRLERNLNLVLQVLEITGRAVICLNLMDEAERHGVKVDVRQLSRDLGVPVIPASARFGHGLPELLAAVEQVAREPVPARVHRLSAEPPALRAALRELTSQVRSAHPGLPNARWVAMRLLGGDDRVAAALRRGELAGLAERARGEDEGLLGESFAAPGAESTAEAGTGPQILGLARRLREGITGDVHEYLVEALYADAARIAGRAVSLPGRQARATFDATLDRIVTSRLWGFPVMLGLFALMFWLTITGANVPSALLADLLVGQGHPWLQQAAQAAGLPGWLRGLTVDGMYLATAWVVSVMLPPMAIFFPLFTLLEDFGYLPRVAFNLDRLFQRAGAHGRQAMSTMMGFGCNAAGVVATRIIDSPRERLIAILTNNFALCNGRWPTQILVATLFIGGLVPAHLAGLVSAAAVTVVALLGVGFTFATAWLLSRTILKGQVSTFSLELPPYRPPRFWRTLYTSLIDRTLFVLWRAVVFALPCGALIWGCANVHIGGLSLAEHAIGGLDPLGLALGLNGVILLAYIIAIPANEIIIPTILMLTVLSAKVNGVGREAGVIFELDSPEEIKALLTAGGWTVLTGLNLMLFSLLHNPCSTTIYTIYKETRSVRWAALATFLPLAMGFAVTGAIAVVWRWLT